METKWLDELAMKWDHLGELKKQVLEQGFSAALFDAAIVAVGIDPLQVSAALERRGFHPKTEWLDRCRAIYQIDRNRGHADKASRVVED